MEALLTVGFISLIYAITYAPPKKVSSQCPPVIDPKTMEQCDLRSEKGQRLMKNLMRHHFDYFLEQTKDDWNYVLPSKLKDMDKSNLFLLDVRRKSDYDDGHIEGTTNIYWLDLMKPENLDRLPKDKTIVVICYLGHTASQVLVMLKLLGFKAVALKFGMGISPIEGVPVAGWTTLGYPVIKNN